MTKEELDRLKKALPKNHSKDIAAACDCSRRYVDMVLSGRRKNLVIIQLATRMALDHKDELKKISNKIKSL